IRRFFSGKKSVSNTRSTRSFLNSRAISFDCNLLSQFFNSFGSQNMTEAVYRQLLDSLGLENMAQLNEYIETQRIEDIKLRLHNDKDVSINELNYYVFSSSKLGWKNIDLFADLS